ncbi:MAG: hypothetical protein RLZZ403_1925 [Pseudomonadota bacterium]
MRASVGRLGGFARRAAVLLVLLQTAEGAIAANGIDDFRILYAEALTSLPVLPLAAAAQKSADDPLLAGLRFDALGRRFELSLERNTRIMRDAKSPGVAYRGSITPLPGSWVRLTRTGNDLHGLIWDTSELYVIEPAHEARAFLVAPADYAKGTNVIYRLSDTLVDLGPGFCNAIEAGARDPATTGLSTFKALTSDLKSLLVLHQAAGATLTLSLSALGDASFLEHYPSATEAHDAVLIRLNNVDGIYSAQLGVELSVSGIKVYEGNVDPFTTTTVPVNLLQELGNHRNGSSTLRNDGLTHLFTGRDLDGTTVGIAYIDALCLRQYGVALTESRGRGSVIESLIAAHEIGHNFGAHHDGDVRFECAATPDKQYIMATESAIGIDTFSPCSVAKISQSIAAAACINPLSPPDVDAQFAAAPSSLSVGQTFSWAVTVTNWGGQYATGPSVEVTLPAGVAFVSASVPGGLCVNGAGTVQCSLGSLAAGQSSQVALSLTAGASGVFAVTAVASAANDGNLANNSATATLAVDTTMPDAPPTASATSNGGGGGGGSMGLLMLSLVGLLTHARRRHFRTA